MVKKILNWISKHVRPSIKLRDQEEGDKPLDLENFDLEDSAENIKDRAEVGIKFKFKF